MLILLNRALVLTKNNQSKNILQKIAKRGCKVMIKAYNTPPQRRAVVKH